MELLKKSHIPFTYKPTFAQIKVWYVYGLLPIAYEEWGRIWVKYQTASLNSGKLMRHPKKSGQLCLLSSGILSHKVITVQVGL